MPSSSTPVSPRRVESIDLLRGWAVLVMIETHVVNATLSPGLATGTFQHALDFFNGLVAPSFLFASGMAFAYTARRKFSEYLGFGPQFFRQVARLLLILGIGYMLHLPKFSLRLLVHETSADEWLPFFQADVLHCIAVTLLFMLGLLQLARTERGLSVMAGVSAVTILVLTPVLWGIDFEGRLPAALAAYMNGNGHSLFPLFPWSVFILSGAVAGHLFSQARESDATNPSLRIGAGFIVAGCLLIGVSVIVEPFANSLYATYDYWRFSPSFVMLRLGIVVILFGGFVLFEKYRGVSPNSLITLAGRESLMVYVVHLLLLYGDFASFNFQRTVNHTFGYIEAAATTILLTVLMILLARWWGSVKRQSPVLRKRLSAATVAFLLIVFVFGPGS